MDSTRLIQAKHQAFETGRILSPNVPQLIQTYIMLGSRHVSWSHSSWCKMRWLIRHAALVESNQIYELTTYGMLLIVTSPNKTLINPSFITKCHSSTSKLDHVRLEPFWFPRKFAKTATLWPQRFEQNNQQLKQIHLHHRGLTHSRGGGVGIGGHLI